jgi:hypothetical protein
MSKVVKAISAPFKAVANVSKSILSGIKKGFKTLTSSTFGKVLLIAATVYLGGAAFGMWNSPFQAINGAFVSPAAEAAGAVTATGASEAGGSLAAGTGEAAAGTTAGAGDVAVGTTAADTTASSLAAGTESVGTIPASGNLAESATTYGGASGGAAAPTYGAVGGTPSGGIINSFMNNPLAQYGMVTAGAGALQGAFSPNAIDVEEERAKQERQNLEWRNSFLAPNFQVGSLNLGMTPGNPVLRDANGNPIYPAQPGVPMVQPVAPGGIINTAMRPR